MSTHRTARPLSTPLAAAVLVGGLALTSAAPALAAPAATDDGAQLGWFEWGDAQGRFHTQHSVDEVRVTVAPVTLAEHGEWPSISELGPETDVEFTYDAELERGAVDFVEQRRVLAEEGVDYVAFTLYAEGEDVATAILGPDEDLGDEIPGEFLGAYGPQDYSVGLMPTVDHQTLLAAPGSRLIHVPLGCEGEYQHFATVAVAELPEHGRLVAVPWAELPEEQAEGLPERCVYVADEGFTGRDQATFTFTADGETKTLVVTFSIGDERADAELDALPLDEDLVWAALEESEEEPPAPTAPAEPTTPAEPSAPAEPTTPGSSAPTAPTASAESEHTVPDTVETGSTIAWWLAVPAALGALGAAAMLAGRRLRPTR